MKKTLFILLAAALLLCSCAEAEKPVEETPETQETQETEAVEFPRYNETLSPNGEYLLYNHSPIDTVKHGVTGLMVGVEKDGKPIHTINVNSLVSMDIMGVEWLSDSYFAVTTHVNPSTLEYFIYSVETGEEVACYNGYSFTPIKGEEPRVIYAENVPHGFGAQAYHSYAINGTTVYTSAEQGALLSEVVFSEDMTLVAFIEKFDYETGRPDLLVTGHFDGSLIEVLEKTELDPNVPHNIKISPEGVVTVE